MICCKVNRPMRWNVILITQLAEMNAQICIDKGKHIEHHKNH